MEFPSPEKEFGPKTSLKRRRLWGTVAIAVLVVFLVLVLLIPYSQQAADMSGRGFFGRSADEALSPQTFILLALGLFGAIVAAHFYSERRSRRKEQLKSNEVDSDK